MMTRPAFIMTDDYRQLLERLAARGQKHLSGHWARLDDAQRRTLGEQLASLDLERLDEMRRAVDALKSPVRHELSPAPVVELADRDFPYRLGREAVEAEADGERALRSGAVACLLVAGGQGTRLGFEGPKGCFPVLPLSRMTLFEVFARKLRRAGADFGVLPPLYIMVSRHNEQATTSFFEAHGFFGLKPENVKFFAQGELPALDDQGRLVLEAPGRLFMGPDGHGGVLEALGRTGMLEDMRARGVRVISYFQVDNLQVPVADAAFIGLHLRRKAQASLKVVRKLDWSERVGVFCLDGGKPCVVEYSEFSEAQARRRDARNQFAFWAGSIAVHLLDLAFCEEHSRHGAELPLHAAHKKIPLLDDAGRMVQPAAPNAYKFERFIFDVLPMAATVAALEVPREEQFLPLKNPDGPFGPEGVAASYQDYWRKAVKLAWPGLPPGDSPVEVDPLWCENARELAALARGLAAPQAGKPLRLPPQSL